MFAIAEGIIVVRRESAVEGTSARVVRAVVPDVLKVGIVLACRLHEAFVEGLQILAEGGLAGKLRVVAQAIYAVIAQELRSLFGASFHHLVQRINPLRRTVDGTVGNAGDGRNRYAVLMRDIEEASGHAAEGRSPVAPVRHIRPEREDFRVEDAIWKGVLVRGIDGNPCQKLLVVGSRDVRAHLRGGIAEMQPRLHARYKEVVVFAHLLARLPVGERLSELSAGGSPCYIVLLQLLRLQG